MPSKDAVTGILRRYIDGAEAMSRDLGQKDYTAERGMRPAAHNHENEMPSRPVLGFDLHRTLTPDYGFPLLAAPFPGLKAFMDRMVARGCCIHIMTASLDRPDVQIISARKAMVVAWVANAGLPVSYIGPNVDANVRLDDRGVTVESTPTTAPDWVAIGRQAEQRLAMTWTIDPITGRYVRRDDIIPVGTVIENFPEITDTGPDAPRGWSTPQLDIDLHRTINPGWGSTREDNPPPGCVTAIQGLYADGWQIQMSCGGWMRSTHTQAQSDQRLASFRIYLRKWGIPFDRIVTKDDVDLWFDDKVVRYTSWSASLPRVIDALVLAQTEHPSYNPLQPPAPAVARSNSADLDQLSVQIKELGDRLDQPSVGYVDDMARLSTQFKELEAKLDKQQPIIVTVNLPEGMINSTTNVAPPNVTIEKGAIQVPITNAAAVAGDLEIQHPDGRRTTLRRSRN
jgi:hypothetical protein